MSRDENSKIVARIKYREYKKNIKFLKCFPKAITRFLFLQEIRQKETLDIKVEILRNSRDTLLY